MLRNRLSESGGVYQEGQKRDATLDDYLKKEMEPPGGFFVGYYRNRSANKYQHVRARSHIADKLAVLRRVGEQHESYQRVCITASINNAIFTSSIRESYVDTCAHALVCDSARGRCIAVTLSTACGRYTVVNKAETSLAENLSCFN